MTGPDRKDKSLYFRRMKDRRKRVEWPLFPGYCFARFPNDQRLLILQSPGVIGIIGSTFGQSEPIPDQEIAAIRHLVSSRLPYDVSRHLAEGMAVRVVRGPLIGLKGILMRKSDGCRLVVQINVIGQGAAVHIHARDTYRFMSCRPFPTIATHELRVIHPGANRMARTGPMPGAGE